MLTELERAEQFIFMEYFILKEGYMWEKILEILERKVQAGVEVRVMYDGTCAMFDLPFRYPELLKGEGHPMQDVCADSPDSFHALQQPRPQKDSCD